MNCKYCGAELVEGKPFCPDCGKEQKEEEIVAEIAEAAEETVTVTEEVAEPENQEIPVAADPEETAEEKVQQKPKANPGKIAAAVVAGVLVVAILVSLLLGGTGNAGNVTAPTEGVLEATEPVEIPYDGDPTSYMCKPSYTVSDEEAAAAGDVVVATMGDKVLTNGELQAYYWQEVYLFLQEYGSYAQYIGLDLSVPFDQQLSEAGEKPMSWQQFFLESAIYSWQNYQSMALEAEAVGYKLPADRQTEIDSLPADLESSAKSGGFANVDEMIKSNIGPGCSLDAYLNYVKVYYQGLSYYYDYVESLDPTDEEIEAFFDENVESYAAKGITKDTKYVDVRHVLLMPEGGETGADGYPVYTDEAWEACRIKAEEIYNNWQQGDLSEDSFAQLAKDHSEDGNASTGGLYENVYVGQMVENFENWCFDEARQVGDHGLVKTPFGYHIMFFSGSRAAWPVEAELDLIDDLAYNLIPAMMEKYPAVVDFSLVALSDLDIM